MNHSFLNGRVTLHAGDCLAVLPTLPENSVDAVVTDPPYHLTSGNVSVDWKSLGPSGTRRIQASPTNTSGRGHKTGFMGKQWDGGDIAFRPETWAAVLRVLKPGGHMLAFAAPKNAHRMVCAIEDAGFEIRDTLMWLFGSGFPKSLDVSKAIDKAAPRVGMFAGFAAHYRERRRATNLTHNAICEVGKFYAEHNHGGASSNWEAGNNVPTLEQWAILQPLLGLSKEWLPLIERVEAEREIIAEGISGIATAFGDGQWANGKAEVYDITAPATDAARAWEGWGTALKPAWESVICAYKPLFANEEWVTIAGLIDTLESRLWSMLSVKAAERHFKLSRAAYEKVVADSVEWRAESGFNILADLSALMDTSQLEWATISSLNIVSSWRRTLGELWTRESMSTIATELSTTTDWKTLRSCLSATTPDIIIRDQFPALRSNAPASTAARYFSATLAQYGATLEQHALASAIAPLARRFPDEVDTNVLADPICLARKPLSEGTVAANVLRWGTGALNIDGARIPSEVTTGWGGKAAGGNTWNDDNCGLSKDGAARPVTGRWPANILHDGSEEVVAAFPESAGQQGDLNETGRARPTKTCFGDMAPPVPHRARGDSGSAARFFYSSKADADDRIGSKHPTVKPLDLMQYLVRLVTPPKGTVLDIFAGTGTTGEAAWREGFSAILIEREPEYIADIERRMALALAGPDERARESIKARLKDKPMDAGPLFDGAAA